MTPENHPDYYPLGNALDIVKEMASTINENIREAEQIQAVAEMQSRITGLDKVMKATFYLLLSQL